MIFPQEFPSTQFSDLDFERVAWQPDYIDRVKDATSGPSVHCLRTRWSWAIGPIRPITEVRKRLSRVVC